MLRYEPSSPIIQRLWKDGRFHSRIVAISKRVRISRVAARRKRLALLDRRAA